MSQGDLSSWIVAGSFVSQARRRALVRSRAVVQHAGVSGRQPARARGGDRRQPQRRRGLRARSLDRRRRRVGRIRRRATRATTTWPSRALQSARGLTLEPREGTRVTTVARAAHARAGRRGVPARPAIAGPWLPPERTFSPLAGSELRVERARYLDVLFEHEFASTYVVGVRRFFQGVDDQVDHALRHRRADGARSVGHYYVASAGDVDAQGWGVQR